MSLAGLVVTAVLVEGRSKSEVAREYRVSRRWVITLVQRFQAEGEAGLAPRSRRPRSCPQRIGDELEDEVVALRKDLAGQGLDAGAGTIAAHLQRAHGWAPAPSTIWRILSRRGLITPQPQKRPKSSLIRFEALQPNERWQADVTHWQLADGAGVEILNLVDDHSRLDVASDARPTTVAADVVTTFRKAVARHGIPAGMLSDNGAIFTGAPRGQGRVALEIELAALSVRFDHSRPYHPQTCGKVERFHQTQKKWLAKQPPAATVAQLQRQLDRFASYYNTIRPHRAVGRRTPAEAFAARPKAHPAGLPSAPHHRVRTDTIDKAGSVTIRYNSRMHHIGLGRLLSGTKVIILAADLDIRVLTLNGELLRALTLDPTRDYQPRGAKKGPQRSPQM